MEIEKWNEYCLSAIGFGKSGSKRMPVFVVAGGQNELPKVLGTSTWVSIIIFLFSLGMRSLGWRWMLLGSICENC